MMKVFGLTFLLSISLFGYSQRQTENNFSLNLSVGNFIVGHEYITGIWTGVDAAYTWGDKPASDRNGSREADRPVGAERSNAFTRRRD